MWAPLPVLLTLRFYPLPSRGQPWAPSWSRTTAWHILRGYLGTFLIGVEVSATELPQQILVLSRSVAGVEGRGRELIRDEAGMTGVDQTLKDLVDLKWALS